MTRSRRTASADRRRRECPAPAPRPPWRCARRPATGSPSSPCCRRQARAPSRHTLVEIASSTGWALANAASEPDAITVMVPACAPTRPPDTGESSIRKPASAMRLPSARAASGATVAQHRITVPGRSLARQPLSPNSTASVCAALMTNTTTASMSAGSSAGDPTAAPPAAANSARAAVADFAAGHRMAFPVQVQRGTHAHGAKTDDADFHKHVPFRLVEFLPSALMRLDPAPP